MSKGLEALERIKKLSCVWDSSNDDYRDVIDIVPNAIKIIEKELKALEIIEEKGIAFLVPESDYSNEHIHIDIYTNTLSEEELKTAKEVMKC